MNENTRFAHTLTPVELGSMIAVLVTKSNPFIEGQMTSMKRRHAVKDLRKIQAEKLIAGLGIKLVESKEKTHGR